jgi:hypothetical protein
LDSVKVFGREVLRKNSGVFSGIQISKEWFTTRGQIPSPQIHATDATLTVSNILFGGRGLEVNEVWRFSTQSNGIVWRVERSYLGNGLLEDMCCPGWEFEDLSTWTGGLLGNGGVAWCKLFNTTNASYGVHTAKVTFWNKAQLGCLRIVSSSPSGDSLSMRFTHLPNGAFGFSTYLTGGELVPKNGLSRFQRNRSEVWQSFDVRPGTLTAEFFLSALDYKAQFDRGQFCGLDGEAIREICHTIARIGVVDELLMGSNGYYSDCAVLHEPWLAQMGIAIDDPDYVRALSDTLDSQRKLAIGADGRVKPRWAGHPETK